MKLIKDELLTLPTVLKQLESKITKLKLSKTELEKEQKKLDKLDHHITSENYVLSDDDYVNMWELQAVINYASGDIKSSQDIIKEVTQRHRHVVFNTKIANDIAAEFDNSGPVLEDTSQQHSSDALPLQLQAYIKGLRTSAIIMTVLSILSFYFIPWAVLYIVVATKLKPENLPNRKLIKGTAIATLPLCIAIIPILVNIEFWKMNNRLKQFEDLGSKAFISDKQFLAEEPTRKKNSKIVWTILLILVAIFGFLLVLAIVSGDSDSTSTNNQDSFLKNERVEPYTSAEHGFKVNFPGFPVTESSNSDVDGKPVPSTTYTKEIDNGNKAYLVQAVEYPPSDFVFTGNERGALDGAINGSAQSDDVTLVTSTNNGVTQGYPSASATFKTTIDGQTYDMYTLNILKGNTLYVLMTIGENKETFDSFANSFSFN